MNSQYQQMENTPNRLHLLNSKPEQPQPLASLDGLDWAKWTETFLASTDVNEGTRTTYKNALRLFMGYLSTKHIQSPTIATLIEFKHYLQSNKYATTYCSTVFIGVRRFFHFMELSGAYENIGRHLHGFRKPRHHLRNILSDQQISSLFEALDNDKVSSELILARDRAILTVMFFTAIRCGEVTSLTCASLETKESFHLLRIRGKGRDMEDDFVILVPHVYKILSQYLSLRADLTDTCPLFATHAHQSQSTKFLTVGGLQYIIAQRFRQANIPTNQKISAHSIRHTAITKAAMAGSTASALMAFARHANYATTSRYIHLSNRLSESSPEFKVAASLSRVTSSQ